MAYRSGRVPPTLFVGVASGGGVPSKYTYEAHTPSAQPVGRPAPTPVRETKREAGRAGRHLAAGGYGGWCLVAGSSGTWAIPLGGAAGVENSKLKSGSWLLEASSGG